MRFKVWPTPFNAILSTGEQANNIILNEYGAVFGATYADISSIFRPNPFLKFNAPDVIVSSNLWFTVIVSALVSIIPCRILNFRSPARGACHHLGIFEICKIDDICQECMLSSSDHQDMAFTASHTLHSAARISKVMAKYLLLYTAEVACFPPERFVKLSVRDMGLHSGTTTKEYNTGRNESLRWAVLLQHFANIRINSQNCGLAILRV